MIPQPDQCLEVKTIDMVFVSICDKGTVLKLNKFVKKADKYRVRSSRRQNVLNHFSSLLLFAFIFVNVIAAFAGPGKTTYQAKIVKPDGYPLEATSVNFKFTILDPAGSCILYSETYSSVNMSSTSGLISFALGSGVKTYPASATTFEQVFSNITPSLSCDTGGPANYTPIATDTRKIVMQFHDGTGWQTLPAMNINAVPYAMYANEATKLNGLQASDFVQVSTVPTCTASEALRYTGASFSCVAVGNSVTSGTVITALGYTPADGASVTTLTSNISSVSSTVFSVSSTVTSLQSSVAASFAAITSSQWTTSGTNIFYSTGNMGIGTTTPVTKLDVSGGVRIGAESTTCAPALAGTLRYNASNVEYCNGTSWQAFGVSGAGITNINGSTSGTQTFATGTGGTAPAFNTSNGVHTLNIPLANTGSVTAGLISNADYTTFSNKITSSAASIAQVLGYVPANDAASGTYAQKANNLSDLTNITTARTNLGLGTFATASSIDLGSASATGTLAIARLPSFTGDATIAAASNTIILSNSGVTAGTYTKVVVDSKGRVTSGAQIASSDVTTALGYTPASASASTQWTTSGSAIYYNTGNVGIGTTDVGPSKFVVKGGALDDGTGPTYGVGISSNMAAGRLATNSTNNSISINTYYNDSSIELAPGIGKGAGLVVTGSGAGTNPNTIQLFTNNGSERLRIDSSGNVGIGTTAPTAKLHLQDGTAVIKGTGATLTVKKGFGSPNTLSAESVASFDNESGSGVAVNFFGNSAQPASIYMGDTAAPQQGAIKYLVHSAIPTSQYMSLSTSSTERLRIDYFGNVGIGMTALTAKLHLASGTTSVAPFKFTSGTLLTSAQSGAMEYDGANLYFTDGTNTRRAIAANTNPGTYDNVSNINSSSNITLTPTGSVVVSSTTASTNSSTGALVVKGGLGVAGDLYTSGTIVTSSNIQGVSVTATSGMISPYIAGSVVSGGSLILDSTTHTNKGNILFAPNGGNVGIGTASPAANLHVVNSAASPASAQIMQYNTTRAANNKYGIEFRDSSNEANASVAVVQSGAGNNAAALVFGTSAGTGGNGISTPVERMRLDNAGNVGIGTTNPQQKVHVDGAGIVRIQDNDDTSPHGYLEFGVTTAGSWSRKGYIGMPGAANAELAIAADGAGTPIYLKNTTGTVMTVSGSNVGIGTSVLSGGSGNLVVDGLLQIKGSDSSTLLHLRGQNTDYSGLKVKVGPSNVSGGSDYYDFTIRPSVGAGVSTASDQVVVRINNTYSRTYADAILNPNGGNVGIGTTSPFSKMHIQRSAASASAYVATNSAALIEDDDYALLDLATKNNGLAGVRFNASTDTTGAIFYYGPTNPAGERLSLLASGTEKVSILPNGNVGIGTTNPTSKLSMDVSAAYDGIRINSISNGFLHSYVNAGAGSNNGITQAGDKAIIYGGLTIDNAGGLVIAPWKSNTSGIRLDASGNVGIGTTTPAQKLSVAGTIESTSGGFKFPDGSVQASANGLSVRGVSPANPATSCTDAKNSGFTSSGLVYITVSGTVQELYCEQTLNGGGYLMLYNSVLGVNTTEFWYIPKAQLLTRRGHSTLDSNFYDGSFYTLGTNFMDVIEDLRGKQVIALVATATSFDSNPASAGFMKFSGATMVSGDTNIFNVQFASGFSAPDFDNDTHTANCATDYSGVSQHYGACWSYNLGSDADTPYYDGGVGPHLNSSVATSLGLYNDGTVYTRVRRITRFVKF